MRKNLPVSGREEQYASSANLLSTTDLHSVITYANPDFAQVSGYSIEELKGQPHNIVRHPEMPPQAFKMLWDNLRSGRSWMGLVKNRCKNGDHYWVNAYITPILLDDRTVQYQSIRVQPKREWVKRAEALYTRLLNGDTPSFLKGAGLPFLTRLIGGGLLALLAGGLVSTLLLKGDWGAMLTMQAISGVLLSIFLWRFWQPIREAVEMSKSISEDPIAKYVYTGRSDEAGQLMLSMRTLCSETGALVGRVADDARRIKECSAGMLKTTQVSALHSQADQVATAANQMSTSIQEVAQNASVTADAASEARQRADQGRHLVTENAAAIKALAVEIEGASKVIEQLEQDSEGINTIVDVIRSVAEQTNLLALNAAIEAARAGEQGRGFAVVADEVRTLANRTHESTAEITTMIEKLQAGSRAAVRSMAQAEVQAQKSVVQAESTAEAIEGATTAIGRITDMSVQIASAVEQQGAVAEEINRSIVKVSELAQELAEAAANNETVGAEVYRLTENLQLMAQQLFLKNRQRY